MVRDEPRPLPRWMEQSLEHIEAVLRGRQRGLSRREVSDLLLDEGEIDDPSDVAYAVERLLERGYLYEVDGEIYLTNSLEN